MTHLAPARLFCLGLTLSLLGASGASAATIVDTGVSGSVGGGLLISGASPQQYAGKFQILEDMTITSVGTHLSEVHQPGDLELRILASGGSIPSPNDPTSFLFSALIPNVTTGPQTASGLDWSLPAGEYWIGPAAVNGFVGSASRALVPVAEYAVYVGANNSWSSGACVPGGGCIALLVEGEPASKPIPEPAAAVLFGVGSLVVGCAVRRKRQD